MVQEVDGMENAEIAANVSRLHCDWRLAVLPSGIAKWHGSSSVGSIMRAFTEKKTISL